MIRLLIAVLFFIAGLAIGNYVFADDTITLILTVQ